EERGGNIDAADQWIGVAAMSRLIYPESKTGSVRRAIQKIIIVLSHEELRRIDWVDVGDCRIVILDGDDSRGSPTECDSDRRTQLEVERLALLTGSEIVNDQHRNRFTALTWAKPQRAERGDVVTT